MQEYDSVQTWLSVFRNIVFGVVFVSIAALIACGDGDEDGSDEGSEAEAPATAVAPPTPAPEATSAPTQTPVRAVPIPTATAVSSRPSPTGDAPPASADSLPSITTMADVLFTNLLTGQPAFEVDVQGQFGEEPTASFESYGADASVLDSVRANLQWVRDQGYASIETFAIEGFGTIFLRSPTLEPLRHEGFDYDRQYSGDPEEEELAVEEEDAKQRYNVLDGSLAMVLNEAHALARIHRRRASG